MSRSAIIAALAFAFLAGSPLSFGQSRDRRLDDALLDIRLLKQVVDQQSRRIAELEKTVKELRAAAAPAAEKPAEGPIERARPAKPAAWQIPFAWTRIKNGMSRTDVEDILGPPTSVDSVLDYQTLNYKGDAPGRGTISGSVRLVDDRVAQVNAPDF